MPPNLKRGHFLEVAGCNVLRYNDGQITTGAEVPPVSTDSKPVGVKPRGRPQKDGVLKTSKTSAGVDGGKRQLQMTRKEPSPVMRQVRASSENLSLESE